MNIPKNNTTNNEKQELHKDSSSTEDNYTFNPKDIVSEDENGYTVRHGDHFHYIPKNKVEKPAEVVKPTPVVPTPVLPNLNKVDKPVENVKPSPIIPTPSLPEVNKEDNKKDNVTEVKPSVLSFAGVQYETSDGFKLSDDSVTTATSTGLLAAHSGHQHFIFYKQLVNSKWEKLIPYQYLNKAKEEYAELEKEVNDKINYLSQKNNIGKDKFSY